MFIYRQCLQVPTVISITARGTEVSQQFHRAYRDQIGMSIKQIPVQCQHYGTEGFKWGSLYTVPSLHGEAWIPRRWPMTKIPVVTLRVFASNYAHAREFLLSEKSFCCCFRIEKEIRSQWLFSSWLWTHCGSKFGFIIERKTVTAIVYPFNLKVNRKVFLLLSVADKFSDAHGETLFRIFINTTEF